MDTGIPTRKTSTQQNQETLSDSEATTSNLLLVHPVSTVTAGNVVDASTNTSPATGNVFKVPATKSATGKVAGKSARRIPAGAKYGSKSPAALKSKLQSSAKIVAAGSAGTSAQTAVRRTGGKPGQLRRSMSYDTLPRMKNKAFICQPMTVQRRLAVQPYKNQHLLMICLAFISFTSMLALAIISPFFPAESALKGMRESVIGLIFSVYALVYMVLSPIMGLIIPVVGTKMTLILGVFIAGVSNILFGLLILIPDLETFTAFCFLVRIFEAIGGTAFSTATYTILMEEFPDNIGTTFSIVETSVGLGLSLGPAIGGFLYNVGGYGLPFYVLGSVMLLNIPLCLVIIRDSKNSRMIKSPRKAYMKLLSIGKVVINIGVIVVASQLFTFLDPTLEPHLREMGLMPYHVILVFLIMSATYSFSSPFIGWIATMVPNKFRIMSVGLFLLSIEFLFLGPASFFPIETTFTQTAIVVAFIGISESIAFIPTFETMLKLAMKNGFPDDVTTYSLVSGIWSSFYSCGEIFGPMLGGFLTEHFGFKSATLVMAVMAFIMAIFCTITCIYYSDSELFVAGSGPSVTGVDAEKRKRPRRQSLKTGQRFRFKTSRVARKDGVWSPERNGQVALPRTESDEMIPLLA